MAESVSEVQPRTYKYCIVPCCSSNTRINSEKAFFLVPKDLKTRYKWLDIMKTPRIRIGLNTTSYVCEDHFDVRSISYFYSEQLSNQLPLTKV